MAVTDVTAVAFSLLALVLLQRAGRRAAGRRRPRRRRGALRTRAADRSAGPRRAPLARGRRRRRRARDVHQVQPRACSSCRRRWRPSSPAGTRPRARVAAGGRAVLVWLRLLVLRLYLPMLVAFVVASPFVVLDAPHFLRDFRRQSEIMDRGWLGFEHVGNGFWFNVTPNLTGAIGVVLVVLAVAGLAWALWRRTRLDLMLAPYVIVYFVYIGTWKELGRPLPAGDRAAAAPARGARLRRARRPGAAAHPRAWPSRWPSSCSPSPSLCRSPTPSPSTAR